MKSKIFLTDPFFRAFVKVKSKLTPRHNLTLSKNLHPCDELNQFQNINYYLTYYFSTSSSYVAEITLLHTFAGVDRGSLRMPTDIFVSLSHRIA